MNKSNYSIILAVFLFVTLLVGCTHYPLIQQPDLDSFSRTVSSPSLRDSLLNGKLTAGMPHIVISQLFKNWNENSDEIKIPVASLGSKQRLEELEGWRRHFVDPNAEVFLDQYETEDGMLCVWYQRPNFYSMDVSARDTLCVFIGDTVLSSVINYLNKSSVLTVKDSLPTVPVRTKLYTEIHYNDHPWRYISYWYNTEILSNARTFKIGAINYEMYPVELLEFNNEPISSYDWKEANKNEN
jgi:hypothetical protein